MNSKDENYKTYEWQRIEIRTYTAPPSLKEAIEKIAFNKNTFSNLSKEEIINQALYLFSKGNILEASELYKYCLDKGFEDLSVLVNYGIISKRLGQNEKAIKLYKRAIGLFPKCAEP